MLLFALSYYGGYLLLFVYCFFCLVFMFSVCNLLAIVLFCLWVCLLWGLFALFCVFGCDFAWVACVGLNLNLFMLICWGCLALYWLIVLFCIGFCISF